MDQTRPYRGYRLRRLTELLEEAGGAKKLAARVMDYAAAAGVEARFHDTEIHAWKSTKNPRQITDEKASLLESATGKRAGWMDTDPDRDVSAGSNQPQPREVIGWLGDLLCGAEASARVELGGALALFAQSGGADRYARAILEALGDAGRAPWLGRPIDVPAGKAIVDINNLDNALQALAETVAASPRVDPRQWIADTKRLIISGADEPVEADRKLQRNPAPHP